MKIQSITEECDFAKDELVAYKKKMSDLFAGLSISEFDFGKILEENQRLKKR